MGRKYDREFKLEAVRLAEESNNAALIEKNLNISSGCIYRWRKKIHRNGFESVTTKKHSDSKDIKLKQLERENKQFRTERDILKKAVHIFTKDPNRYSGS